MNDRITPQVLIVGAGPTGLTLALTLRRFGIGLRVIERLSQPASVSKALAVWSGSMEALHGMEVTDRLLASGRRLHALTAGIRSRQLAVLPISDGIDSPYPFPLLLPQSRTEAILTTRLAELGVTVERGIELAALQQDAEGVTATLRHIGDGQQENLRVAYLIGCDGARSTVRHALEIAFDGYTEPATYVLGDVRFEGVVGNHAMLDDHSLYLWWGRGGSVALFPFEQGVWRIFAERKGQGGDAPPTPDELQAIMNRHGPPGLRVREPTWLSTFHINERLAARYRAGRCFLAGDAAHIHSPAGGQGMNTGIQDAVNLGWKLGYVLGGIGDAELLLDSYEAERRPVARAVIDGSAQRQHVVFASDPVRTLLRSAAVAIFGRIKAVQQKLQVDLSETDIVYRAGALVALGKAPHRPHRTDVGSRARDGQVHDLSLGSNRTLWSYLSELRHTLLLFETEEQHVDLTGISDLAAGRLQVLHLNSQSDPGGTIRRRYRIDGIGWVLIRPDQVVAARGNGTDLAPMQAYIDRILR